MNILDSVKQWWTNNCTMTIHCSAVPSSVILSKKLFESVQADHPTTHKRFDVLFSKLRYTTNGAADKIVYVMFFNPEFEKHGVKEPKHIQTVPLTMSKQGHIGFQTVQPTVREIQAMYGKKEDNFDISVEKSYINGEPYYILKRD